MFWYSNKKEDAPAAASTELDVLLAELKSREDFLQSQIKNESTNFLAILSSAGAAAAIYASEVLTAQGSARVIPGTIILGLAIVSL